MLLIILALTGCLKGDNINLPAVSGSVLQLEYIDVAGGGTNIRSGLQYFGAGALTFPSTDVADTVNFTVNAAGADPVSKDVAITIGVDTKALLDNFASDSINYLVLPDSTFKIINKTATIKAGGRVANFAIVFYPNKFNATKSFNLPITVTDPQGYTVSANYGHIYFHAIGNAIAGSYTRSYSRWNSTSATGAPTTTGTATVTFVPDNTSTVEVQSGYGTQNGFNARYKISFTTSANGTLSNFNVVINPDDVNSNFTPNTITLVTPASIILADPVTGHYKFSFQVTNSSGAYRTFIDEFTK